MSKQLTPKEQWEYDQQVKNHPQDSGVYPTDQPFPGCTDEPCSGDDFDEIDALKSYLVRAERERDAWFAKYEAAVARAEQLAEGLAEAVDEIEREFKRAEELLSICEQLMVTNSLSHAQREKIRALRGQHYTPCEHRYPEGDE